MPLNEAEIAGYKKQLEELRAEMVLNVSETVKEVKDADQSKGYSQHQADEGTDDFVQNINLKVTNTEYTVIKAIDKALEKIEEGTYGICEISGEEISKKRLDAVPYATMTVKAQEELEKMKKRPEHG